MYTTTLALVKQNNAPRLLKVTAYIRGEFTIRLNIRTMIETLTLADLEMPNDVS